MCSASFAVTVGGYKQRRSLPLFSSALFGFWRQQPQRLPFE